MQLYQAIKLRTEHGQFAMNIGATSILDKAYLDDDDSQASNDDDDSQASNDDDENVGSPQVPSLLCTLEIPQKL